MSVLVDILGGGGIVAALGGICAVFVRTGRVLEQLDGIEERLGRLERWQDNVNTFGKSLVPQERPFRSW